MSLVIPKRTIRGIRDSIPSGHVLGRVSGGDGATELIPLATFQKSLTKVAPQVQNWNAGQVNAIGSGLSLSSGTLSGAGGLTRITSQHSTVSNTSTGTSALPLLSCIVPANTLAKDGDELRIRWEGGYLAGGSGTQEITTMANGIGLGGLSGGSPPYLVMMVWSFFYTSGTSARAAYMPWVTTTTLGAAATNPSISSMFGAVKDVTTPLNWAADTTIAVGGANGVVGKTQAYGLVVDFISAPTL